VAPRDLAMSSAPVRIQLSRKKGWKMPPNTVKVDRATRYGNPFGDQQIGIVFPHPETVFPARIINLKAPPSRERMLDLFVAYLRGRMTVEPLFLEPLRGKNLGCWCKAGELCHADVLLSIANS
jgi:hypothetical protein